MRKWKGTVSSRSLWTIDPIHQTSHFIFDRKHLRNDLKALSEQKTTWPITVCHRKQKLRPSVSTPLALFYICQHESDVLIATIFRSIGRQSVFVCYWHQKRRATLGAYCARPLPRSLANSLSVCCLGQVFSENCKQFKPHTLCRRTAKQRTASAPYLMPWRVKEELVGVI